VPLDKSEIFELFTTRPPDGVKGIFISLTEFRVGYVEFSSPASVAAAVALSGQKLLGIPIIVQASGAEKNYTGEMALIAVAAHAAVVPLFVLFI
jgi:sirohydrochlorin ferrochelatase